jgi:hypothetical protein
MIVTVMPAPAAVAAHHVDRLMGRTVTVVAGEAPHRYQYDMVVACG